MSLLKKVLAGSATLGMLLATASLIAPDKAQALACVPVEIPAGAYGTGVPCGSPRCPGEIFVVPGDGTVKCIIFGTLN
jgi:hypothetical protein